MDHFCKTCNSLFNPKPSELNRGNGKYCSKKCSGIAQSVRLHRTRTEKIHNVFCSFCLKTFYLSPSKHKNSKSGLYFCCRNHKDLAQRIGGIREIMPPHYGISAVGNNDTYRRIAFEIFPAKCIVCGYDKYKSVLEVHHKDGDRTNNDISNLEIRCPTHHVEWHYETKTGKFLPTK